MSETTTAIVARLLGLCGRYASHCPVAGRTAASMREDGSRGGHAREGA